MMVRFLGLVFKGNQKDSSFLGFPHFETHPYTVNALSVGSGEQGHPLIYSDLLGFCFFWYAWFTNI